jgi:hypothetical protein
MEAGRALFPEEELEALRGRQARKLVSSWGNPRCLDPADEDDREINAHTTRDRRMLSAGRREGWMLQARQRQRMHPPASSPSSEADTDRS